MARRTPHWSFAKASVPDPQQVIRRVFVYTVRDDKLAECWLYDEDQPFVDTLWSVPTTRD